MASFLFDVGIIIAVATAFALVAKLFKQPSILAYIVAGIVIGPFGLGLIKDVDTITSASELGLALLLFIVGLELDVKKIRGLGKPILAIGLLQVALTLVLGFLVALAMGFSQTSALYLGIALSFSSTAIVVKILSDKHMLNTLTGRLVVGVLLVQDIVAIIVLILQSSAGTVIATDGFGFGAFSGLAAVLAKGVALFALALVCSRIVFPRLFAFVASSQELLFLVALSSCLVFAYLASLAGFSIAVGALLAGVAIATLPYNFEIGSKILSLRDFFVTIFFAALGMQIAFSQQALYAGIILSAFVIVSRLVIVTPLLYKWRFGPRVSVFSSIALAQSSEFSFVIVALGASLGQVSQGLVSLIAMVMVITIVLSSYAMINDDLVYSFVHRVFHLVSGKKDEFVRQSGREMKHRIIVLGCHRLGSTLVDLLTRSGEKDFLVVDYYPHTIDLLRKKGIHCVYGDLGNPDTIRNIGVENAKVVLSTVSDDFLRGTTNMKLLKQVKAINPKAEVFVPAEHFEEAVELYKAGADYVIMPRELSGANVLKIMSEPGSLRSLRRNHVESLKERIKFFSDSQ